MGEHKVWLGLESTASVALGKATKAHFHQSKTNEACQTDLRLIFDLLSQNLNLLLNKSHFYTYLEVNWYT